MILRRGHEFAPGYRLQKYIGKGQFGEVWRASGPGGVTQAAKFINLEDSSGQKEYVAIKRIKSIRHANLMQITGIWQLDYEGVVLPEPPDEIEETFNALDVDSQDTSGFVSTSGPEASLLVVGMLLGDLSLEKYVPKRGDPNPPAPVAPGDLLRYMEGVARGLDFLNAPKHDFGTGLVSLQHCDIKPANIVLIGDSAVICDFGLARVLKRSEATMTSAAGTPAYMSPEAINGRPSRNSDQYSLAVTYYHLRTGKLPLDDGSVQQVLQTHLSGNLQFSRVPEIERQILKRATDKDWKQRYPSNSGFIDAIRVALTSQGLNTVGDGAGPAAVVVQPAPPQASPNGPAVMGVDTLDSEDLTDAFVRQSKGGSPIISGSESKAPWSKPSAQEGNDAKDTFHFGDAIGTSENSADASAPDLAAEVQMARSTPELAQKSDAGSAAEASRWRQPKWMISVGIAALAVSALWIPFSGTRSPSEDDDSKPPVVLTDAASLMAESFAILARESPSATSIREAIGQFRAATMADPKWLTVSPELSLDRHGGAVEVLLPVGSPNQFITTGFDQDVRWWTFPNATDASLSSPPILSKPLSSVVLGKTPHMISNHENVKFSANGKTLFVAARDQISSWAIAPTPTLDRDAFPIPAAGSWWFRDEILAVAVHPTEADRVVVALADLSAVVIEATPGTRTTSGQSVTATIAETDMSDVAAQLRFLRGGEQFLVRQEGGVVVVYDWDEFATNRRSQSAATAIPTRIANARVVEVPPPHAERSGFASDLFWVGDDRGVVSAYRVLGKETKIERVDVDDDAHRQGITTIASAWTSSDALVLATGNDQGGVAIHVATPTLPSGASGGATDLRLGPASVLMSGENEPGGSAAWVRCLTFSRDGKWLAAAVGNEVWVAAVSLPEPKLAVFPISGVSADSVLIDEDHDRLVVGCGDGGLATLNWSHCRLRVLAGPVRVEGVKSIRVPPVAAPQGKFTHALEAHHHVAASL